MARFIQADINLSALQANFQLLRQHVGDAHIVAVVKANGYGHGAVAVARALPEADIFGVACIDEAFELRDAGVLQPVLLLEGFFEKSEINQAAVNNFEVVLHSSKQLQMLVAAEMPQPITVWLKLDSGMHRLGFSECEFQQAYNELHNSSNVKAIRLMTHFACADDLTNKLANEFTQRQVDCFKRVSEGMDAEVSLANSAGLLAWPEFTGDWVRPGLALYGCSPLNEPHSLADQLLPVMTLSSRLIAIHKIEAGEGVGYGQDWHAEKDSIIGTVAVGYGDGYPRQAGTGTPVLVNGQRSQLIGRVSMDMISVDLTDLPETKVGDPVVLWGEGISANEIARYADTIPYVLLTGITGRVPLHYHWDD